MSHLCKVQVHTKLSEDLMYSFHIYLISIHIFYDSIGAGACSLTLTIMQDLINTRYPLHKCIKNHCKFNHLPTYIGIVVPMT